MTSATPWERQRIWYEPPPHQLLMSASVQPSSAAALVFSTPLARGALAFVRDHQVSGRILLPGAAMFEMASAAIRTTVTVCSLCCRFQLSASMAKLQNMHCKINTLLLGMDAAAGEKRNW